MCLEQALWLCSFGPFLFDLLGLVVPSCLSRSRRASGALARRLRPSTRQITRRVTTNSLIELCGLLAINPCKAFNRIRHCSTQLYRPNKANTLSKCSNLILDSVLLFVSLVELQTLQTILHPDKLNRHSESSRSCTSTVDSWVLFGFVLKCLGCTSGFSNYFSVISRLVCDLAIFSRSCRFCDMLIMVLLSYNHCFVSLFFFQCQNHDFLILICHFIDPWLGNRRHFKWHNCIKQKKVGIICSNQQVKALRAKHKQH